MQTITVTVHGALGVLDLAVPADARVGEVSRVYADRVRQPAVDLSTVAGAHLDPAVGLSEAGVRAGGVLVATSPTLPPPPPPPPVAVEPARPTAPTAGSRSPNPAWLGALLAALAAAASLAQPSGTPRLAPVLILVAAAALALLPAGSHRGERAHLAPVLAAAAALAWFWRTDVAELPLAVGVAGLAGAATAGLARALRAPGRAAQAVWMGSGVVVFLVVEFNAVLTGEAAVAWAVLFVAAALAPRWIPGLAVVVPDRWLVDMERHAAAAWSARDDPSGPEGSEHAPREVSLATVAGIAERAERVVTAASVAVLVVTLASGTLLVWTATVRTDQVGALAVVGCGAISQVLAARGFRHRVARAVLRASGLAGMATVGVRLLVLAAGDGVVLLGGIAILLALGGLVLLLFGRDRPARGWPRIADLAETGSGAIAVGGVVVAVGLFRHLWTTVS